MPVYLRRHIDEEGTPSLALLPGIDLDAYKDSLVERFSHPEIRDTLARLGAEPSDRIPKWLVRQEQFFGPLSEESRFSEPYLKALTSLHERGAKDTARSLAAREEL